MKMKSTDIKLKLDKSSKELTNFWRIIRSENIVNKGITRNYDLKQLLKMIEQIANERMQLKLDQMCINLGLKNRSDFPKESIYPTIFKLSEINEQYVQLGLIKTLDPVKKSKYGKKKLNVNEELTRDYINKLRENLQLQINGLKKKLTDFNEAAELDIAE